MHDLKNIVAQIKRTQDLKKLILSDNSRPGTKLEQMCHFGNFGQKSEYTLWFKNDKTQKLVHCSFKVYSEGEFRDIKTLHFGKSLRDLWPTDLNNSFQR